MRTTSWVSLNDDDLSVYSVPNEDLYISAFSHIFDPGYIAQTWFQRDDDLRSVIEVRVEFS